MKQKLTPWFDGTVKPVRVGVYQRKYHNGIFYCYWDGKYFSSGTYSISGLVHKVRGMSPWQDLPWRGVMK